MISSVPKIFHFIWFDFGNGPRPTIDLIPAIISWERNHPGWEIKWWDEPASKQLVEEIFEDNPEEIKHYDKLPYSIQRVDIVRACIMHKYGGVYVDTDFVSKIPLDRFLEEAAPKGSEFAAALEDCGAYTNSMFISSPGHPFWLNYLWKHTIKTQKDIGNNIGKIVGRHMTVIGTGPLALTKAVRKAEEDGFKISKLPERFFNNRGTMNSISRFDDTGAELACTFTSSSWVSKSLLVNVPHKSYVQILKFLYNAPVTIFSGFVLLSFLAFLYITYRLFFVK